MVIQPLMVIHGDSTIILSIHNGDSTIQPLCLYRELYVVTFEWCVIDSLDLRGV